LTARRHKTTRNHGNFAPAYVEQFESRALLSAVTATLVTDLADYQPGATAVFTGAGFQPGEVVELQVLHDASTPAIEGAAGHETWSVIADANGSFTTTWFVNPDDSVGAAFDLIATGSAGSSARTTFTDGLVATPGLSGTAMSSMRIDLSWSYDSAYSDPSEFHIRRSTNNGPYTDIATVSGSNRGFSDISVTSNNTYFYSVSAHSHTSFGHFSHFSSASFVRFFNRAPSFTVGGDVTVEENSAAYSGIQATDINDNDAAVDQVLTINVTNGNNALFSVQPSISSTGQLTFTPAANASGNAIVVVTLTDDATAFGPALATSRSFSIYVTAVNDAPVANNDSLLSIAEDSGDRTISFSSLTGNDTDVDGDALSITAVSNAVGGTVSIVGTDVIFAPSLNFNGAASFDYTLSDGSILTDTGSVSFAITPVNDAPSIPTDSYLTPNTVAEGAEYGLLVGVTASSNDLDGDTLTYSLTDNAGGRFAINSTTGIVTVAGSSLLDGPATYTITVEASDGAGGTSTANFTIDVSNMAPTATNNSYGTPQATVVSGNVITDGTADSDPAGANDPLTVSSYTQPANGTVIVAADGSYTYTPDTTFSGTNSFTYTISDGDGGFDTATVEITVTPAAAGSVSIVPDTSLGGTALLIIGTSSADNIVVEPGTTSGTLLVTVNGVSTTVAAPTGRIIVLAGAGDDNVQIAGSISNQAWLYGGDGNDRLNNGGGGGLLIGGDGNDQLTGGNGRDIMVAGRGSDKVVGNGNDDIIIAGYTTKDDPATAAHEKFWGEVTAEWNSANSFLDRVNNLRGSATQNTNNNNNRSSYLLPEAMDDNAADAIDMLQGGSGNDWFIFKIDEDKVVGQLESSN